MATITQSKTTKVTRKYGPDGKVVEEVVETSERPLTPEETDKLFARTDKAWGHMDRAFGAMNDAFASLYGKD